jgi:ribosome-associated translation inhibitor RaiA
MQTPLKITFRHMTPSAALDAHVREHVEDLARVHDRIIACDVVIDAPAGRHAHGECFDVRVNVKVPNGNFNVRNDHAAGPVPHDVYAAVREVFGSLERMLAWHSDNVRATRDRRTIRRNSPARPEARQP